MFFKDVIGQEQAKEHLLSLVHENRIPHAMLFTGTEGCGKMPLALAFARYVCCEHPGEHDACGQCQSCLMMNKYRHPDVHFAFPVVKTKPGRDTVCDDYISQWRETLMNPYRLTLREWMSQMGATTQQPQIFVHESNEIQRKLSHKSMMGGYKVMIIWLPEKMNQECGNKLLKLIEEPPAQTLFLLVTEAPDAVLPTIVSRTQRFNLPPVSEEKIAEWLETNYSLQKADAQDIAHRSKGSLVNAIDCIASDKEENEFFTLFTQLMRLSYARRIREMKAWSEQIAGMGRERQKNFLNYCQDMIRENFVYNFHTPDMNYMTPKERQFATRFSPFISEKNVIGIMDELNLAARHIEQNVNAKFVFFDFALKMIVLLLKH